VDAAEKGHVYKCQTGATQAAGKEMSVPVGQLQKNGMRMNIHSSITVGMPPTLTIM
jgi:hypothetical protein